MNGVTEGASQAATERVHQSTSPSHTHPLASPGMTGMLGLFFCGLLALIPGIYYSRIAWLLLRNRADGYVSWEDVPTVS